MMIVYKATRLEIFLSRFLPYFVPFISNRKRVKIRWYFKYRYRMRLTNDLVKTLKNLPPPDFKHLKFDNYDWEWEVCMQERVTD